MQKIIIDTNFILSAIKFKIKMPHGIMIVPSGVIAELRKISKSRRKDARLAKVALEIIKKRGKTIPTRGHVDNAILNYATSKKCMVATNDRNLIKELKANGIRIIRIRQRKYIVEE